METILNQIGIIATIFGLPVALYTYWKSRQIQLTSTAECSFSFTVGEFPFSVTVVNDHPRQVCIDKISFVANYGGTYEISYAVGLLEISQILLTDGEKIQIRLLGNKIVSDLAWGIKNLEREIPSNKVKTIQSWIYISTGKKFPINLEKNLRNQLLAETRLAMEQTF